MEKDFKTCTSYFLKICTKLYFTLQNIDFLLKSSSEINQLQSVGSRNGSGAEGKETTSQSGPANPLLWDMALFNKIIYIFVPKTRPGPQLEADYYNSMLIEGLSKSSVQVSRVNVIFEASGKGYILEFGK